MLLEYHCGQYLGGQYPGGQFPGNQQTVYRPGVRVRLAGSKVNAVVERELGGTYLADFISSTDDPYLKPDCDAECDHSPDEPKISTHSILLCDGQAGTYRRLAFPLAPLPSEVPMAVVVFLEMTISHTGCSGRSLQQIRGPLWIDRN